MQASSEASPGGTHGRPCRFTSRLCVRVGVSRHIVARQLRWRAALACRQLHSITRSGADPNPDAHSHPDARGYADAAADAHTAPRSHADTRTYSYPESGPNTHTDPHAYPGSNTHAHSDSNADSHAHPQPDHDRHHWQERRLVLLPEPGQRAGRPADPVAQRGQRLAHGHAERGWFRYGSDSAGRDERTHHVERHGISRLSLQPSPHHGGDAQRHALVLVGIGGESRLPGCGGGDARAGPITDLPYEAFRPDAGDRQGALRGIALLPRRRDRRCDHRAEPAHPGDRDLPGGGSDEIEIQVKNVTLDELTRAPYKAAVDFDKIFYGLGSRQKKKRETFVAQLTFVLKDQIPNAMVLVNPLGLTITYFPRRPRLPMIANSAFLAAMVPLLLAFVILGEIEFLAPYKHVILGHHLWVVVGSLVVVFLNLFAVCYLASRRLFLKDTGRKLAHVERQLRTADAIVHDLSDRLAGEE